MLETKVVEAEVAYCRRALSVALERALFSPSAAERARALAVVASLEERLTRALLKETRMLAH